MPHAFNPNCNCKCCKKTLTNRRAAEAVAKLDPIYGDKPSADADVGVLGEHAAYISKSYEEVREVAVGEYEDILQREALDAIAGGEFIPMDLDTTLGDTAAEVYFVFAGLYTPHAVTDPQFPNKNATSVALHTYMKSLVDPEDTIDDAAFKQRYPLLWCDLLPGRPAVSNALVAQNALKTLAQGQTRLGRALRLCWFYSCLLKVREIFETFGGSQRVMILVAGATAKVAWQMALEEYTDVMRVLREPRLSRASDPWSVDGAEYQLFAFGDGRAIVAALQHPSCHLSHRSVTTGTQFLLHYGRAFKFAAQQRDAWLSMFRGGNASQMRDKCISEEVLRIVSQSKAVVERLHAWLTVADASGVDTLRILRYLGWLPEQLRVGQARAPQSWIRDGREVRVPQRVHHSWRVSLLSRFSELINGLSPASAKMMVGVVFNHTDKDEAVDVLELLDWTLQKIFDGDYDALDRAFPTTSTAPLVYFVRIVQAGDVVVGTYKRNVMALKIRVRSSVHGSRREREASEKAHTAAQRLQARDSLVVDIMRGAFAATNSYLLSLLSVTHDSAAETLREKPRLGSWVDTEAGRHELRAAAAEPSAFQYAIRKVDEFIAAAYQPSCLAAHPEVQRRGKKLDPYGHEPQVGSGTHLLAKSIELLKYSGLCGVLDVPEFWVRVEALRQALGLTHLEMIPLLCNKLGAVFTGFSSRTGKQVPALTFQQRRLRVVVGALRGHGAGRTTAELTVELKSVLRTVLAEDESAGRSRSRFVALVDGVLRYNERPAARERPSRFGWTSFGQKAARCAALGRHLKAAKARIAEAELEAGEEFAQGGSERGKKRVRLN